MLRGAVCQCLGADGDDLASEKSRCLGLSGRSPPGACPPASTTPCGTVTAPSVAARAHSAARAHGADGDRGNLPDEADDGELDVHLTPKLRSICQLDPGWMLSHSFMAKPVESLASDCRHALVACRSVGRTGRRVFGSALAALRRGEPGWRRSLARDANDPDPDAVARAGLLCRLGWWAVAAVDPEWLARWWHEASPLDRRQREIADLGTDLDDLGRRLAERWGCEPLTVDAAWLHGSHGPALLNAAAEPARLAYIQQACRWAEQTPWSLDARGRSGRALRPSPGCGSWWPRFKHARPRRSVAADATLTKSG